MLCRREPVIRVPYVLPFEAIYLSSERMIFIAVGLAWKH